MPFNGLGLSGGGFGQAGQPSALGAVTSQAAGVAAYGSIWASSNCPSCNTAIVDMQTQLIRVAGLFGVVPSTGTDGRVGAGTVATLQAVGLAANSRGLAWGTQIRAYVTTEAVAKNADTIRNVLAAVTAGPSSSLPSGNAGQVMTYTPPMTTPAASASGLIPGAGTTFPATIRNIPTPYLIGGGILFVGVIAAAVILLMPPSGGHNHEGE